MREAIHGVSPDLHNGLDGKLHNMDFKFGRKQIFSPETLGLQLLHHFLVTAVVNFQVLAYQKLVSFSASHNPKQITIKIENPDYDVLITTMRDRKCPLCVRMGRTCPYHGWLRNEAADFDSRQTSLVSTMVQSRQADVPTVTMRDAKCPLCLKLGPAGCPQHSRKGTSVVHFDFREASFVNGMENPPLAMTFSQLSPCATDRNHAPIHSCNPITLHDPQTWLCCKCWRANFCMAVNCVHCPHGRCTVCIEAATNDTTRNMGVDWISAAKTSEYSLKIPGIDNANPLVKLTMDNLHVSELGKPPPWKCCRCSLSNPGWYQSCDKCSHCICLVCRRNCMAFSNPATATKQYPSNTVESGSPSEINLFVVAHSAAIKDDAPTAMPLDPTVFRCCICRSVSSRLSRRCVSCNHIRCSGCPDVQLNLGRNTDQATPTEAEDNSIPTMDTKHQSSMTLTLVGSTEIIAFAITEDPASDTAIETAAVPRSCANESWMCHFCRWPNNEKLTACNRCQHGRCEYCNTLEGSLSVGTSVHHDNHIREQVTWLSTLAKDKWRCRFCTALNDDDQSYCLLCSCRRPKTACASFTYQLGAQDCNTLEGVLLIGESAHDENHVGEHVLFSVSLPLPHTWRCHFAAVQIIMATSCAIIVSTLAVHNVLSCWLTL